MARTTKDSGFQPEVFDMMVQGELAQQNVFMGRLAATGAALVEPTLSRGQENVGDTIKVPYFGWIGDFEDSLADGAALTPRELKSTTESATVERHGLAFETTAWARVSGAEDPHREAARQTVQALGRKMDTEAVDAALATGVQEEDNTGSTISWDMAVEAKARYGDDVEGIAAMAVHSQTKKDMTLLKDNEGRPLLVDSMRQGDFDTFAGMPVIVSDRVGLSGSAMGTVAPDGTSPPAVTLAGTPESNWDIKIECVVGGLSDGTATFRFSTDDGDTWSGTYAVPSGGGAFALDESHTGQDVADSLVGNNGTTGITATFANGTYNADNVWRAEANILTQSLLLQKSSILLWWNRALLTTDTDKDILRHSQLAAMNLYMVAHRYRRRPGGTRTGVVSIKHGVSRYNGTLDD